MARTRDRDDRRAGPITLIPSEDGVGATGLTGTSTPPQAPSAELRPEHLERYVLAGVHHDREPGNLLVVLHPLKRNKVPRDLFAALRDRGYELHVVETQAEFARSISAIRDKLVELAAEEAPLDLMVISGDGSLDHHVLVAAYSAFYPDLVEMRPGRIDGSRVTERHLEELPPDYRRVFFPRGVPRDIEPSQANITLIWLLRSKIESAVQRDRSPERILRLAGRDNGDPLVAVAVLAARWPQLVDLVPEHYDLERLAEATLEESFRGLYPWIRAIACYPAGVAADNAVFAGVPGWTYATAGNALARLPLLDPLRRWAEKLTTRRFVDYFCSTGVVVPARLSVLALDRTWRLVCGHVLGGPAAGHFFTKDLTKKTQTLVGYLVRIPKVIINQGIFGKSRVRVRSFDAHGRTKSHFEGHLAEGLYTNRTYAAGVASVPTTNPTSFAGQSSLLLVPPLWSRAQQGRPPINLRGLFGFSEAIVKGLVARALHTFGFGTGTLTVGGRIWGLLPGNQVAIKEGERITIEYFHMDGTPRGVPVVVSGDPFQARRMDIKVLCGPIPMLGGRRSLLVSSTRKTLTNLRMEQSFDLEHTYIGGVRYFRHRTGQPWTAELSSTTGLILPPLHLPRTLGACYELLRRRWQAAGAGEFTDTSKPGLPLVRKGIFAHNNDQTAHLLVLRQSHGMLLVRLVRARPGGELFETRSTYGRTGASYIIDHSQTIHYVPDEPPRILREAYYFRDAERFQKAAAAFLPIADRAALTDGEGIEDADSLADDEDPGGQASGGRSLPAGPAGA